MFRVKVSPVLMICCVVLVGANSLPVAGQPAIDSHGIDVLLNTLATGSDEAATAALLQLDAESDWFLPRYEQVADVILKATGSLDKKQLANFLKKRHYEAFTPFDKLLQNKGVDRKELLAFWVATRIQAVPYDERKEQVLRHFLGLVEKMLTADNVTPETVCNLLMSFRHSVFYPFALNVVPQHGGELAIDLYLRYLDNPSDVVAQEVFEGLCRMGFCYPSRREEIRKTLITAYPERGKFLDNPYADMSRTLPRIDAPITEEEYVALRRMDASQLTDELRSRQFPRVGRAEEFIIFTILSENAQKGDESTYEALFSLGEEVSASFRGLDMIASTLGRGAARFNTDEEKADAFLQFLATRVQQSTKKSEAIEVAATVLHEAFIAPIPGSPSGAPPIPGTEHAVQALEALAQQSTIEKQKARIEENIVTLQEKQTRYDNEMKKKQESRKSVKPRGQAASQQGTPTSK